ncbi:protein outspread isoform X2 [Drosophila innubila]|uniref:protein outspread isoform X2 n=1 Tax=Drosophila innubila TaxID=198719 RepID=UPI00148D0B4C|nr:protein outspread isoform X2 [Drosophila innubila]
MSTSTITTTTSAVAAAETATPPPTASVGRTADCRKFSPNIFNKSKCSHCFRQREEHSAAALECNRASRKVSKCGYLFVAPDWDFSNPLYRTKRWQRRWFVLYDDGEFTYSVDDYPETVPQASIDMTKVLDVSSAEEVTGHTNSIAITAPERVTFVKGISSEESQWWLNILTAFPKSKGRHKRSTTLSGGQISCLRQSSNVELAVKLGNRHSSYHKDTLTSSHSATNLIGNLDSPSSTNTVTAPANDDEDDGVETGEDEEDDEDEDEEQQVSTSRKAKVTSSSSSLGGQDENNRNAGNEITNRVSQPTGCLLIEDMRRDEKSIKDIANTITNLSQQQGKRWSTMAVNNALNNQHHYQYQTSRDETDFQVTSSGKSHSDPQTVVNLRPKSLPLAANSTPAIVSAIVKKIPTVLVSQQQQQLQQQQQQESKQQGDNVKSNKSAGRLQLQLQLKPAKHYQHERGDPDGGCNLDELCANYMSKSDELRSVGKSSKNSVSSKPSSKSIEESLNAKKGWLMKLDNRTGEWSKHWFTLSGAALFYYRDPLCEERGVLDGVLDVNSLSNVVEEPSATKQHAFQLITWDKQRLFLASLSPSSRNSWLAVLRSAAGLPQQLEATTTTTSISATIATTTTGTPSSLIKSSDIEQDFIKAQLQPQLSHPLSSSPATPGTPANGPHFSSDEEYRTASEGGRRDSLDWGSPLSPSPPVLRSCLRNRSLASLHKRSRSSPPSSRRSTVDSVASDELPLMAVPEETRPDRELKQQCETLRTEAKLREARMSELLTTLQRTEQELTARLQEQQQQLNGELTSAKQSAAELVHSLSLQLTESQCKIKQLEDRLAQGIEENESLYKRLRDFQADNSQVVSSLSNLQRHKMKRMDSLSDLTTISDIDPYCLQRDSLAEEYNELRSRFEKAVNEIRAMKRELKQSQNQYDALELIQTALQQKLERCQMEDGAQLQLMAARIQDLTIKYSTSERQVRALKQKLAKSERRRSLSLKGKEQLELKLSELQRETKVERKAGDCSTASTTESSSDSSSQSSPLNAHLLQRLHSLEHVLLSTKERLEQSLNQLQQLRANQRSRRSVSPLNERKDGLRQLERALAETCVLVSEQMELSCLQEACHKCCELRQRVEKLTALQQQTETDLQRSEQLLEQRESELAVVLEKCATQEQEQQLLLQQRNKLSDELGRQQERCKRLEKRLDLLEREHGKQLECLREVYRHEHANVADEQSFRKRYQTEIEQLRTLCEKGLSAMESSHRRLICDMEEKHKLEIERLLAEKETALAEETQATLAALDAMRKAHQSEVQREVARFKAEFLLQVQRGEHMRGDGVKLKEEELDELRLEILSFSEKYSIKCVENAALEEKLHMANGKLRHFQQMQQLELRNQQFRAHLASDDPGSDVHFVQGLTTGCKEDASCEDSEV